MTKTPAKIAFEALTAEDDGRVCKDIPESACNDQPNNFIKHIGSLSLTKTADGLIDPKLILSWILTTLGAPALFIGLLVPIRESGALLPQLFTAGYLRSLPLRKYAWAAGSFVQGLSAAGIAWATMSLEGKELGITIVSLLALLAIARSVCSVSYKDVLGKTVDKSKRGTATGTASSIAAGLVIIFALLIASQTMDKMSLIVIGLWLAAAFWILSSILFSTLTEEKGATEGGKNPVKTAIQDVQYLRHDHQLQIFILTRGLLIATALAPPFMVALLNTNTSETNNSLGWLILASSSAALCSSYIWGRLADHSSRKVLLYASLAAAITLSATLLCTIYNYVQIPGVLPTLLFGLMIAYQGVRLGRSTHLVDMTDQDKRAAYTALSNTAIGILLLLGSVFGILAQIYGETLVIGIFAVMSLTATISAFHLKEVQTT